MRKVLAFSSAEIVEHANAVATLNQRRGNMRADEAGAAGDQVRFHRAQYTRRATQPPRKRENRWRYSSRRTVGLCGTGDGASSSIISTGSSSSGAASSAEVCA